MSMESLRNGGDIEAHEMNNAEKESLIRGTYTFEQLYVAIDKVGTVPGSQEEFTAEQLKDKIERVRKGELELNYITRTYGIRDTVERSLAGSSPEEPPELEAAVALELPHADPAGEADPEYSPDTPPELAASNSVELPTHNISEKRPHTDENSPNDPISPLTGDEVTFYHRAQEADELRYDTVYQLNLQADPERYLDIHNPEVQERYNTLKQKMSRYDAVVRPNSFEELAKVLENSSLQNGDEVLSGSAVLSTIEKVRDGVLPLTALPESMQQGIASLVAKSVFERLTNEQDVDIPEHEWELFMRAHPPIADYLGSRHVVGYPQIGADAVRLKGAVMEGTLVWADTKSAVFKTSKGFQLISTDEILMENGKTRSENNEERMRSPGATVRQRPLPK